MRDPKAVKALISALRDQRCAVVASATVALVNIGEPAVKPLMRLLKGDNVVVQLAKCLATLVGVPKRVEDWSLRSRAEMALRSIRARKHKSD
jgi:HEAT repeat protein